MTHRRRMLLVACSAWPFNSSGANPASPTRGGPRVQPPATSIELLQVSPNGSSSMLPPGWEVRPVRRQQPPQSRQQQVGQERVWTVESAGGAAWYSIDLRAHRLPPKSVVEVVIRIDTAPRDADLTVAARSDAAVRWFIVLQPERSWWPRPRMLMYSIGGAGQPTAVTHPRRELCELQQAGPATGRWHTDTLSPLQDAQQFCGWRAEQVLAFGFMQDTDQTGTYARLDLRAIRILIP